MITSICHTPVNNQIPQTEWSHSSAATNVSTSRMKTTHCSLADLRQSENQIQCYRGTQSVKSARGPSCTGHVQSTHFHHQNCRWSQKCHFLDETGFSFCLAGNPTHDFRYYTFTFQASQFYPSTKKSIKYENAIVKDCVVSPREKRTLAAISPFYGDYSKCGYHQSDS